MVHLFPQSEGVSHWPSKENVNTYQLMSIGTGNVLTPISRDYYFFAFSWQVLTLSQERRVDANAFIHNMERRTYLVALMRLCNRFGVAQLMCRKSHFLMRTICFFRCKKTLERRLYALRSTLGASPSHDTVWISHERNQRSHLFMWASSQVHHGAYRFTAR